MFARQPRSFCCVPGLHQWPEPCEAGEHIGFGGIFGEVRGCLSENKRDFMLLNTRFLERFGDRSVGSSKNDAIVPWYAEQYPAVRRLRHHQRGSTAKE